MFVLGILIRRWEGILVIIIIINFNAVIVITPRFVRLRLIIFLIVFVMIEVFLLDKDRICGWWVFSGLKIILANRVDITKSFVDFLNN